MSVINQMLRDLESRPVTPLPPEQRAGIEAIARPRSRARVGWIVFVLLAAMAAAALLFWPKPIATPAAVVATPADARAPAPAVAVPNPDAGVSAQGGAAADASVDSPAPEQAMAATSLPSTSASKPEPAQAQPLTAVDQRTSPMTVPSFAEPAAPGSSERADSSTTEAKPARPVSAHVEPALAVPAAQHSRVPPKPADTARGVGQESKPAGPGIETLTPISAGDWLARARGLQVAGRHADALQTLLEAQARFPRQADVVLALADAQLRVGAAAQAGELLDAQLALDPRHVATAAARARLWLQQDNPREALRVLAPALPAAQRNADVLALAGAAWQRDGQHARAVHAYTQALALEARYGEWRIARAISLESLGQADAAGVDYSMGLQDVRLPERLRRYAGERLTALAAVRNREFKR